MNHLEQLANARSEAEVVELARDFMAQWNPHDLGTVPAACRPGRVKDAEDIADAAIALTRARIESEGSATMLELESFFARACSRISQLESPRARTDDTSSVAG